jgi:hypothetical protein
MSVNTGTRAWKRRRASKRTLRILFQYWSSKIHQQTRPTHVSRMFRECMKGSSRGPPKPSRTAEVWFKIQIFEYQSNAYFVARAKPCHSQLSVLSCLNDRLNNTEISQRYEESMNIEFQHPCKTRKPALRNSLE